MTKNCSILAFALACCCAFSFLTYSQTLVNGNFNSGTASWGCNAETNAESVYGGSSTTNLVAEVDAEAGLCQTVTGLTPGAYYRLTFLCSRRTTCGPTVQNMNVTLSGGVLNKAVSRNGTAFSLALETGYFVASSTSHLLTFTGNTTETCNLIVDNIQITLVSGLPVELSAFSANCSDNRVLLNWTTESEARSDYFTIESSSDGTSWNEVAKVAAQFQSDSRTDYGYEVQATNGISYYRLSLTNVDGTGEILSLVSANCKNEVVEVYPNPTKGVITVNAAMDHFAGIFDASGRKVSTRSSVVDKHRFEVDLSLLAAGLYYLQLGDKRYQIIKE